VNLRCRDKKNRDREPAATGAVGSSVAAPALRAEQHRTLLAFVLAMVAMLFVGFTGAYLVRRTGTDWSPAPLPEILRWNTAVLLASSVALELGRRGRRRFALDAALVLGGLFLAGQLEAWRQLREAGFALGTQAHVSFFYTLSAVHGAHVVSGLVALAVGRSRPIALPFCAHYWHFLGAVWIYVLFVLTFL
jgi:cytochrome c oxidase subunit 3